MWGDESFLAQMLADAINDFIGRYLIITANKNMTETCLRERVGQGGNERLSQKKFFQSVVLAGKER